MPTSIAITPAAEPTPLALGNKTPPSPATHESQAGLRVGATYLVGMDPSPVTLSLKLQVPKLFLTRGPMPRTAVGAATGAHLLRRIHHRARHRPWMGSPRGEAGNEHQQPHLTRVPWCSICTSVDRVLVEGGAGGGGRWWTGHERCIQAGGLPPRAWFHTCTASQETARRRRGACRPLPPPPYCISTPPR